MVTDAPILTIIVALNCEAKPWVDYYRLKKVNDRPFIRYTKPGLAVDIVVSGIGAFAMSTAVGWIGGQGDSTPRVWMNLGVAGHLNRDIGEVVRVHSYIDSENLTRLYSPLTARWSGDCDALMSVNAPTDNYPDSAMVDMEGLAFYKAAMLFASSELIESIKVISDNQFHGLENLNAAKISQIMTNHVSEVNHFSDRLLALVSPTPGPKIVLMLRELRLGELRMTHSQRQQLNSLVAKASALGLHQSVRQLNLSDVPKIDIVLKKLRCLIDTSAPLISGESNG
jgi:nucleoside phosphorylase